MLRPWLAPALVALLLVIPGPAVAWESAKDIVHGSARVLDKGETIIGVVSPLAYGLHERVTVFTHPALHLLLTPNIWGRLSLLDDDTGLALETGYQQSLFAISSLGDYPGFFQLGLVASLLFTQSFQATVAGGYLVDFAPTELPDASYTTGFYWRSGAHLLFKRVNLVMLEVSGKVMRDVPVGVPTGKAIFARQLGRMRLGVGAAFGRFEVIPGDDPLWMYPWADVWWRF